MDFAVGLFLISAAAILGGLFAKLLRLPFLIGYIVSGFFIGTFFRGIILDFISFAKIGTILLLFSIGLELSFDRLARFFKISVFGALIQIILVSLIIFWVFILFGFEILTSFILSIGFSLSSTAVVLKLLSDRGELETIHGGIMFGWLLVQDLAVIPIMVVLPILAHSSDWLNLIAISLFKAFCVIIAVVLVGKIVVPRILHLVSQTNSRELLVLTSFALALGTGLITNLFGISPELGAFLAGVIISESLEHHAVFAEVRPLRDLFVALFFVSLGFLINPSILVDKFGIIVSISVLVLIIKLIVVFAVSSLFGYRGKISITTALGLSQVGEFAFIVFSSALSLKLISAENTSLGIAVTLLTLIFSPIIYRTAIPLWRFLRSITQKHPRINKFFLAGEPRSFVEGDLRDHIIICGYGRVGSWIGKVLEEYKIPFVVVDYNQKIVAELKNKGIPVLYGDPTEPEILELVGVKGSKAIILAIPDRVAQETLIAYVQTIAPNVKIISRAHQDIDLDRLKSLRVDKIVQPEFEAAVEIVKSILVTFGKSNEEIRKIVKGLRMSHSKIG